MVTVPTASPLLANGAPKSFLQLIQFLLRLFSHSRFLPRQLVFYAIAPNMLPFEISIRHSRCIQVLLQSSSRSRSSDTYADVQMNQSWSWRVSIADFLTATSVPRNSPAFSNSMIKNFSAGVTRCNEFAYWTNCLSRRYTRHIVHDNIRECHRCFCQILTECFRGK